MQAVQRADDTGGMPPEEGGVPPVPLAFSPMQICSIGIRGIHPINMSFTISFCSNSNSMVWS